MHAKDCPSAVAPIRVSPNGRHFVDRHGAPFFFVGDTQWHLFRSLASADVEGILRNRKAKGFSVVLVMLIGYEAPPVPNIHGDLPWIDSDPSRPNEAYFAHVDTLMRVACDLDFIQVLGVYHKTQARYYTPEKARASARWIASRYKDVPHIIWSMYPEARSAYIPIARALAAGLREGDGGAHLITAHPDPSPQSSSFLHQEDWLAFNMLQTWNDIELVHPMTAADYGLVPMRPAVMGEGGYEDASIGRKMTALDIRRQAYWTFLAGGHHVYGHDENYKSPAQWRNWIDAPGSGHLAIFRRIVTSLSRWWDIVPDQSILALATGGARPAASGVSGGGGGAAARAAEADWALIYFSGSTTALVRMDRIKASERIDASWINPLTGDKTAIGTFVYEDVKPCTTPEGWEDALLLLEAVG